MYQVDINCDLGESFGNYCCGMDDQVLPFISSANVACGFHASDPMVMAKTVALAKRYQVSVGAHPGFPDLAGFGRRNMSVSAKEAKTMVQYQIGALDAFCRAQEIPLAHVKPHGALYNMAGKDRVLADAICEGILEMDKNLILLGLPGSEMERAANHLRLKFACEVFADRAYGEDGSLVSRGAPGAVITEEDQAIRRVISMIKEGCVETVTGKMIPVRADSVCIHGDSQKALVFVQRIQDALKQEGVQIVPLREKIG
jgi:UPF0271 protein